MSFICIVTDPALADHTRCIETVERKGAGHPDTLCDRISELTSVLYSKYCYKTFGRIAHHWFDKVMLIGGEAEIAFGVGRLTAPYEIILAGKAVTRISDIEIPIEEIFREATTIVLTRTLKNFDPTHDLVLTTKIRSSTGPGQPRSRYRPTDITELDLPENPTLVSNDCNLCTSYYPLSILEQIVLAVDDHLLSDQVQAQLPYIGSDIKTVGWRRDETYMLIVNMPFISVNVSSHEDYLQKCLDVEAHIAQWIKDSWELHIEVRINPERLWERAYLTVTGTVADTGDIGVTGRGNRTNGLITPGREMSIEAVAGKNPLDHTGKLYNALAAEIARDIFQALNLPCKVGITTVKGALLSRPLNVTVSLSPHDRPVEEIESLITMLVEKSLESVPEVSRRFIEGAIRVC
jgi:S-adenosylmethionine synthetase